MTGESRRRFDRETIVGLFEQLSSKLAARDVVGTVFLVGGAAMVLAYGADRGTHDLDAVFAPSQPIRDAITAIAIEEDLDEGWLNDAAKGFLHGPDPDRQVVFDSGHLRVEVASPRYLLAMKLYASRLQQDLDDIKILYQLCGYTTVDEGLDLLERSYPGRQFEARIQYVLAAIVEDLATGPTE